MIGAGGIPLEIFLTTPFEHFFDKGCKLNNVYACIYCKQAKPEKEFNSEHVLLQAFGLYGTETLTLVNKVCFDKNTPKDGCNQKCGDTIDNALARSTLEGTHRFRYGLKSSKDFRYEKHAKIQIRVAITEQLDEVIRQEKISSLLLCLPGSTVPNV